jgi:NADPH-dependent 2,4-dienoyl-CoA reductase/sulfur reductase-like enzyme
LSVAGAHLPHVRALRTLGDADAIIAGLAGVRRAVVVGAGFIGLEAAASLRMRGVDVRVVTPHAIPMERLLGAEMGTFLRTLHESHGVTFHFGDELVGIEERRVVLGSGTAIEAELVIVGIGVAPRTGLAEAAGLCVEDGIVVDDHLETSAPGVFAAGDVARWRDRRTGETRRIEHWAVAGRMGQAAALNMLGQRQVFDAVPFFWSQHYDVVINYVGHAADWDCIDIDGDIAARDCFIRYKRLGALLAAASIGRDMQSLRAELALEGGP